MSTTTLRSRLRRLLDWRFWVTVAAMLLIASLVLQTYQRTLLGTRAAERADQLSDTLQKREDTSRLALQSYTRQRKAALANQRRLIAALRQLQREDRALRRYLTSRGIEVPADVAGTSRPAAPGAAPAPAAGAGEAGQPLPRRRAGGGGQPPATATSPAPAPPAPPAAPPGSAPQLPLLPDLRDLLRGPTK